MNKSSVARILATWFGCGWFPIAPGTVGSAAAVVMGFALGQVFRLSTLDFAIFGFLLFGVAVWSADIFAREVGRKDPGPVVIDEVVGQWITMGGAANLGWKAWLLGFFLFRAFDIWKPFPVRRLERLPGGLGITADDALAGIYAALVLLLLGRFNIY